MQSNSGYESGFGSRRAKNYPNEVLDVVIKTLDPDWYSAKMMDPNPDRSSAKMLDPYPNQ
jgi:hypothetical protein